MYRQSVQGCRKDVKLAAHGTCAWSTVAAVFNKACGRAARCTLHTGWHAHCMRGRGGNMMSRWLRAGCALVASIRNHAWMIRSMTCAPIGTLVYGTQHRSACPKPVPAVHSETPTSQRNWHTCNSRMGC